jgi:hypothetical protein
MLLSLMTILYTPLTLPYWTSFYNRCRHLNQKNGRICVIRAFCVKLLIDSLFFDSFLCLVWFLILIYCNTRVCEFLQRWLKYNF